MLLAGVKLQEMGLLPLKALPVSVRSLDDQKRGKDTLEQISYDDPGGSGKLTTPEIKDVKLWDR